VGRQKYYPFGAAWFSSGALATDYRFTGQRSEEASLGSLYDYGARFYSPVLGQFISPDSIVPRPGDPQSLNRYSYVRNNPVRLVDPSGMAECAADNRACWENEWYWKDQWYKEHGYGNAGDNNYVFTGNFIISNAAALLGDNDQRRMAIKNFTLDLIANGTAAGEALARVTAYAAAFYASVALLTPLLVNQYVDDVSHVLTGMAGPDIVLDQQNGRENTNPYFVGQKHFPDTDLYGIFRDGTTNQAYHFWFYVAVTVWNGPLAANIGNAYHELEGDRGGRSIQDFALGGAGIELGLELGSRRLPIFGVSSWIRRNLMR
jgi:RHS repeat-associated protein